MSTPSKRFPNNLDKNENILLEKIIRDVEVLTEDVKDFISITAESLQDHGKDVAVIKAELRNLTEHVKILSDIVRNGHENGDLPLTSKILLVQKSVDELKLAIEHLRQDKKEIKQEELAQRNSEFQARTSLNVESKRGKWGLAFAILAVIGTIVQALAPHIFK